MTWICPSLQLAYSFDSVLMQSQKKKKTAFRSASIWALPSLVRSVGWPLFSSGQLPVYKDVLTWASQSQAFAGFLHERYPDRHHQAPLSLCHPKALGKHLQFSHLGSKGFQSRFMVYSIWSVPGTHRFNSQVFPNVVLIRMISATSFVQLFLYGLISLV